MNVLQKIFRDNYEIIQYTLHPRDVVMESIDKMINCGDPSFGGAMSFKLIKCPHHHCIFTIEESSPISRSASSFFLKPFSFELPFFFCPQRCSKYVL